MSESVVERLSRRGSEFHTTKENPADFPTSSISFVSHSLSDIITLCGLKDRDAFVCFNAAPRYPLQKQLG
jgi:hypothetical protein